MHMLFFSSFLCIFSFFDQQPKLQDEAPCAAAKKETHQSRLLKNNYMPKKHPNTALTCGSRPASPTDRRLRGSRIHVQQISSLQGCGYHIPLGNFFDFQSRSNINVLSHCDILLIKTARQNSDKICRDHIDFLDWIKNCHYYIIVFPKFQYAKATENIKKATENIKKRKKHFLFAQT